MEKVDAILAACKKGGIDEVEQLLKADATLATASTMLGSQPIHAAYLGGIEQSSSCCFLEVFKSISSWRPSWACSIG